MYFKLKVTLCHPEELPIPEAIYQLFRVYHFGYCPCLYSHVRCVCTHKYDFREIGSSYPHTYYSVTSFCTYQGVAIIFVLSRLVLVLITQSSMARAFHIDLLFPYSWTFRLFPFSSSFFLLQQRREERSIGTGTRRFVSWTSRSGIAGLARVMFR